MLLAVLLAGPPTRAATVSGVVRRAGGPQDPVASARVTLFEPALVSFWEARTDAAGRYSFANIPPATYRLGACAWDLEYVEVEAAVGPATFEFDFFLGPETEPGRWEIIGNTLPEFFDATDIAVLTPQGKVFYCHDTMDPILFDPVTRQKTFPSGSGSEQGCMNATVLRDGRVILVGGQNPADPGSFRNAVPWVKTYDPLADSWQRLDDMQHAAGRWYPGLARLADGSLLVMGGGTRPSAQRTATCERFDLATETWSYTGSMLNPCEFSPSALLHTGEVLATWWPPQLYDPVAGQWRITGNFNQPDRGWPGHSDHSLVMLADGRALALGIRRGPNPGNTVMGEVYDPAGGSWSLTSNPGLVRFQSEVIALPDGRILVAGGETEANPPPVPSVLGIVKWCDLYDPQADAWRRVADLNWFREYHAVTVLVPDGRVLTTGGTRIKFQYGPTSADIEAYIPPNLFRGVRPEILNISATALRRGSRVSLSVFPTTTVTRIVLMGTATHTHWVEASVPRRIVLPVQQTGSTVSAVLPTDANVLPLGHYMLFAMVDDIASVARIVQVEEGSPAIPGDLDFDGDVDLSDFVAFQLCFGGSNNPPAPTCPPGVDADLDADGDVDLADFLIFQQNFTGSL